MGRGDNRLTKKVRQRNSQKKKKARAKAKKATKKSK
jgi:hypothetical protein